MSLLHKGLPPQIGVDVSYPCFAQVCHLNLTREAWLLMGGCFLSLLHTGLSFPIGVDVFCPCFTQVSHLDLAREVWLLTGYCYQLDWI